MEGPEDNAFLTERAIAAVKIVRLYGKESAIN